MIRLLFALVLALAAPAALAQVPEAAPGLWTRANGRISFAAARISLPLNAGPVAFRRTAEFSHPGEGLDSGLQYGSSDSRIFATVYVYRPGLPHPGLTAFATDETILLNGGPNVRLLGRRLVAAGGRDGIALRYDYAGYRDGLASSAAFLKAGRWIVKLRVSGPEARRAEVEAATAALLGGLRFDGEIQPSAPAMFEVGSCAGPAPAAARARAGEEADVVQYALLAAFDGAGEEGRDQNGTRLGPVLPRVGARWCRSTRARIGELSVSILRVEPGQAGDGLGGRTVLLVPVQDSGTALEMVETGDPRRFVLLHHQVGRTAVLGAYDNPLSDEQVAAILSGADREGGQIRASVSHLPNGNSNIELPTPAETPPKPAPST